MKLQGVSNGVTSFLHYTIDIVYSTSETEAEYKLKFKLIKDSPYLALMDELCGVYCGDFRP